MSEQSDAELVILARSGDGDAFGELVRRYQRAAYAVALSVTGRPQDAEDAAQEAFMVALQRLDDCRNPARFAGWFLTIVRNRARNLIRRESLRGGEQIPVSARTSDPGPDKMADLSALRARLREALSTLPQLQREIVLLHDLEGWKHDEISARLGIPSGTVRSHLHFARKALRAQLSDWRGHA